MKHGLEIIPVTTLIEAVPHIFRTPANEAKKKVSAPPARVSSRRKPVPVPAKGARKVSSRKLKGSS